MRRFALAALLLTSPLAAPALAEPQAWNWVEFRVPLSDGDGWEPRALRFTAENNGFQYPGTGQMLIRIGPVWDLTPNLAFGLNMTNVANPLGGLTFGRETTFEAEPTLHGSFGPVTLSYRNRLELRWLPDGQRWRDRNQLRLNFRLDPQWLVYGWDEAFFDLSGGGFNENRAAVGIGWQANSTVRVDMGLLVHSTRLVSAGSAGFTSEPAANIVLVLTPPTGPF